MEFNHAQHKELKNVSEASKAAAVSSIIWAAQNVFECHIIVCNKMQISGNILHNKLFRMTLQNIVYQC